MRHAAKRLHFRKLIFKAVLDGYVEHSNYQPAGTVAVISSLLSCSSVAVPVLSDEFKNAAGCELAEYGMV